MDLEGSANKGAATAAKILQGIKAEFEVLDGVFRELSKCAKSEEMRKLLKAMVGNAQKMRGRMIADAESLSTFMGTGLEAMVQQDKVEKMSDDFSAAIDRLPTNIALVKIEAPVEASPKLPSQSPPKLPSRQPVGENTVIAKPKDPADPARSDDPPSRPPAVDLS